MPRATRSIVKCGKVSNQWIPRTVDLPSGARSDKGIRIDKLLALIGLAESVTDAVRKIKAGAVEIDHKIQKDLLLTARNRRARHPRRKKVEAR